jgi:hypothetical protein
MCVSIIGHRFALESTIPAANASTQKNSTRSIAKLVSNAPFVRPLAAYLLHLVRTEARKNFPECVLGNTVRNRVHAMREYVLVGGLASYGPKYSPTFTGALPTWSIKILRGANSRPNPVLNVLAFGIGGFLAWAGYQGRCSLKAALMDRATGNGRIAEPSQKITNSEHRPSGYPQAHGCP